jgi:hypothetical protein
VLTKLYTESTRYLEQNQPGSVPTRDAPDKEEEMKSLTRRMAVLAIAAAPLTLAACSDDDSPTAASAGTAQVRVAHLSPDAPPVDVYVNGGRAVAGAAFTDVTGYLAVPAGPVNIRVTPAGATSPAVIDATVSLTDGGNYTVAATGLLAGIEPIVLEDDRGTTGQAKVRFVHASPDAPAVDIAVTGGPVLFSNVSFRQATPYPQVAPSTYDLEARPAGSTAVALQVDGVTLRPGTNYTIFAIGLLSNGSLAALPVVDAP